MTDYDELWNRLVKQAADKAGVPFEEVQRRLRDGEAELEIHFTFPKAWVDKGKK